MKPTNKPVIRAATKNERSKLCYHSGPLYACQSGTEFIFGDAASAYGSTPDSAYRAYLESAALDSYYGAKMRAQA